MSKAAHRPKYGNQQIKDLIMEYIHDKNDRKMLYARLVDGDTIGEIARRFGLDDKTVWRRLDSGEKELFSHIEE